MNIQKWNKQDDIFSGVLDPVYRNLEHCDVFYVADRGFAILNYEPRYDLYRRMGIPEIQDVFVLPEARRNGVAKALIRHCEQHVKADMVGISVPVSPQFGAAQRLYYQLGYEPDGNGVTYERVALNHGDMVKLDDGLCLMMLKSL